MSAVVVDRGGIDLRLIPLAQLRESPFNTRKRYDSNRLMEMAASITQQGVIEPLVVRLSQANGRADYFEIIAGSRRFRAAALAHQDVVPCLVRQDVDDDTAIKIMTIENLQREDVHPLEEAEGYRLLIKRNQYDAPGLAVTVGKSESYIYQRLKLLDLSPDVRKAFLADAITAGHAILLARLTPPDQKAGLDECVREDEPLSVRGLAQWIENEIHRDLSKVPFDVSDPDLLPKATACVLCLKRSGTQPSLFPDIVNRDTCLDPACFKAKLTAFIGRREIELKRAQQAVVKVTTSYGAYGPEAKLLPAKDYTKAGAKKCPDTKVALVAGGADLGADFKICTNPRCRVHHPASPRHEATPAEKRDRKRAAVDKIAEDRVLEAVLRTAKVPSIGDRQMIALELLGSLFGESGNTLCRVHDIRFRAGWNGAQAALEKEIKRCRDPGRLLLWAFEIALCSVSRADVVEAAARHHVDVAKIRKLVVAEIDAAKAKPKASSKAKK